MNIPKELKYAKSHEWLKLEDGTALIGISDYAQQELGDIVFVNLPEAGDIVTAGESFAEVESVKAVSDIYSPVSGTVAEVNEALLDDPAKINESPYDAWFVKIKDITETQELIDADEYESFIKEQE